MSLARVTSGPARLTAEVVVTSRVIAARSIELRTPLVVCLRGGLNFDESSFGGASGDRWENGLASSPLRSLNIVRTAVLGRFSHDRVAEYDR